jgi:hypothetical protein
MTAIELTERETVLVSQVFAPSATPRDAASWRIIADAMEELMRSLRERNAIPEARWKFFSNPTFFPNGHGSSRRQSFEKNGTRGKEIFRDPNFVKYLRYFVYGPNLPMPVIEAFQQKIAECGTLFTSGDSTMIRDFARQLARSNGLNHEDAEEFYKLALESGLDANDALSVRNVVKQVR